MFNMDYFEILLSIYALMKNDQLEEALLELEKEFKNFKNPYDDFKMMWSSQLINELAEAVIQSKNKAFEHLPAEIKLKGVIEDVTIEQMTLEPISASPGANSISDEKWRPRAKDHKKQQMLACFQVETIHAGHRLQLQSRLA